MSDWYQQLVGNPFGARLAGQLGLPRPAELRRYQHGQPLLPGPALVGEAGPLADAIAKTLAAAGVDIRRQDEPDTRYGALVYDASGLVDVPSLEGVRAFFTAPFKRLSPSGRLLVFGRPPEDCRSPDAAAVQRALEGFVRSAGKEARAGATANLLYVSEGAGDAIESTLRFFCSGRSAYVSGQVVRLRPGRWSPSTSWDEPLSGRLAVVTGAARGIGAAIATVLARDGADVVCLDVPAQGEQLSGLANRLSGTALQLDITSPEAPERLANLLQERNSGIDVLVHNAGITRDKTLVNMTADKWSAVLEVNLTAQLRINQALFDSGAVREGTRVICISSTSGIAGNRGQTNYAASKAGIIGMVQAMAEGFADRGATINAVAPGFIETEMTSAMPFAVREVGRRINSLNQGGLPLDVAETVAWLGQPGSGVVNGQTVRVCGQSMVGA